MNSEDKFWFSIWPMAASSVVLLTAISCYSVHVEDAKVVEMVKAGADPMRAACSLNLTTQRSICDEVLKK